MTASDKKTSCNPAHRRSQRVLLQVSVLVTAQFEGGPPLTEDTRTVEINVHGALITLAMRVRPGQKLVIKNWSTAKEQNAAWSTCGKHHPEKMKLVSPFPTPLQNSGISTSLRPTGNLSWIEIFASQKCPRIIFIPRAN